MSPRIVIAGFGDSGLLTAIRLAERFDVVGISAKPALVSGQELGIRLARPTEWARDYWISFDRFKALDRIRTEHAAVTGVDLDRRIVFAEQYNGDVLEEPYDALVISTGVRNGFWRQPALQSSSEIAADLQGTHDRLAQARSVMIIGGGAAAVSASANIASVWPDKVVDLYFPHARALVDHHPRTWESVQRRLNRLGVGIHPRHRAMLGEGFLGDEITSGPVRWSSGQSTVSADVVLWAIGQVRPNTDWLPRAVLDHKGFVRVSPELTVRGQSHVYAIGDVAATDPLRSSARNRADVLLARNIGADFGGGRLHASRPRRRRWGSVIGAQPDGLEVFAPNGRAIRFPTWSIDRILQPWIVRRGIYRGIRPPT